MDEGQDADAAIVLIAPCEVRGCDRSGRPIAVVDAAGRRVTGTTCPRHTRHTMLGGLLTGATVQVRRAR